MHINNYFFCHHFVSYQGEGHRFTHMMHSLFIMLFISASNDTLMTHSDLSKNKCDIEETS